MQPVLEHVAPALLRPAQNDIRDRNSPPPSAPEESARPVTVASSDDASDEHLLQDFAAGNRHALDKLFRRYHRSAYRAAYLLLRNDADARDAVAEGFAKVFTHCRQFKGRSTFKTWLQKIIKNAAVELCRARDAQRRAEEKYKACRSTEDLRTPLDEVFLKELGGEMAAILEGTDDRMQHIVRLQWEGRTYQEMADRIGGCPATIKNELARWRDILRRELQSRGLLP